MRPVGLPHRGGPKRLRPSVETRLRSAQLRARMEAAIETMIALLDEMDGDADLEPSLGASGYGLRGHPNITDDREYQSEDEGVFDGDNDTSDYEASLCGITFGAGGAQLDG